MVDQKKSLSQHELDELVLSTPEARAAYEAAKREFARQKNREAAQH